MIVPNKHNSPEYKTWEAMHRRCNYPKNPNYSYYGGRGIVVCKRWMDFGNFVRDMGYRPPGTQLDRIDRNGNYEPNNCRWVTRSVNMRNTSRNTMYSAFNEQKCLAEWAEDSRCMVSYDTLKRRIYRGWSVEDALTLTHQKPGPKNRKQ